MKKHFTLFLLALLACSSCELIDSIKKPTEEAPSKLTIENTQWINLTFTSELEQQEDIKAKYVMDFDLTKKGTLTEAVVITESDNSETPVGSHVVLKTTPYTVSLDVNGNVSHIKVDGVFFEVKDEGNNTISLLETDLAEANPDPDATHETIHLQRIDKPWTLTLK